MTTDVSAMRRRSRRAHAQLLVAFVAAVVLTAVFGS
jgi:hypothetical protein